MAKAFCEVRIWSPSGRARQRSASDRVRLWLLLELLSQCKAGDKGDCRLSDSQKDIFTRCFDSCKRAVMWGVLIS